MYRVIRARPGHRAQTHRVHLVDGESCGDVKWVSTRRRSGPLSRRLSTKEEPDPSPRSTQPWSSPQAGRRWNLTHDRSNRHGAMTLGAALKTVATGEGVHEKACRAEPGACRSSLRERRSSARSSAAVASELDIHVTVSTTTLCLHTCSLPVALTGSEPDQALDRIRPSGRGST